MKDTIASLRLETDVLLAEPNFVHSSPEARRNVVWAIGDPQAYTTQWAPAALRLAEAHRLSTGAGVRVAVLDTGVDRTHPALAGKLLPGFDFVDYDNDPSEGAARPTSVSATARTWRAWWRWSHRTRRSCRCACSTPVGRATPGCWPRRCCTRSTPTATRTPTMART